MRVGSMLTGSALGMLLGCIQPAMAGAHALPKARLTLQQAQKLATNAFPGKIVKQELEQEKGGSGLRYSFDIDNGKVIHEVGIDAVSGALLENSVETDAD